MITHDPVVAEKTLKNDECFTKPVETPDNETNNHETRLNMVEMFLEHHFPKEYVAFFGKDEV